MRLFKCRQMLVHPVIDPFAWACLVVTGRRDIAHTPRLTICKMQDQSAASVVIRVGMLHFGPSQGAEWGGGHFRPPCSNNAGVGNPDGLIQRHGDPPRLDQPKDQQRDTGNGWKHAGIVRPLGHPRRHRREDAQHTDKRADVPVKLCQTQPVWAGFKCFEGGKKRASSFEYGG